MELLTFLQFLRSMVLTILSVRCFIITASKKLQIKLPCQFANHTESQLEKINQERKPFFFHEWFYLLSDILQGQKVAFSLILNHLYFGNESQNHIHFYGIICMHHWCCYHSHSTIIGNHRIRELQGLEGNSRDRVQPPC